MYSPKLLLNITGTEIFLGSEIYSIGSKKL